MSRDVPTALPVLSWGIFGGLAASMFCACWVISVPAGWGAVRWVARSRGGSLGGSGAVGIGLSTGLVLGLVTASFGTLMFLNSLDPQALEESAAMTSAILGEDAEVSRESAALGHAFLAFWANLFFGVMGGLLGAASLPKPGDVSKEAPKYRFEPRQPIDPVGPEEAEGTDPFAPVPEVEVPPEAFQSAWRSSAEGGTPRKAPAQRPPPTTDEHLQAVPDSALGEDQKTIVVGAPHGAPGAATIVVDAALPEAAATIAVRPAAEEPDED